MACAQCHYTCETCSGPGSAECLACSANYHRTLTAAFTCICETGFYLDLSYCFSCSFNCLTCAAASTICLACHPGSTLAATTCDCDAGLYRASDQSCRACPAKCETCSSASTCTACPAGSRRAIGDNCDCAAGYYAGGAECQACAPRCQRCWGAASFCTGCDAAALLTLVNGQCLCQQNYLPDSSGACQAGNPCTSASSSGACQACIQGYVLLQGQCLLVCPSGFFSSSSECSRCPDNCSVCSSAAACVACNPGLKIYRETCFTACPVGSYDSLGECLACHSSCSSCSEGLSCRACRPSAFLSGALCAACHSSCQECRGPSFTECTLCGPALTLQSNRCVSTSCSPTQYFSSVQFACTGCPAGCTGCQQELVRALLRLQCQACDVGYFADNLLCTSCDLKSGFSAGNLSQPPGQCWEVCGDGLRFVLACDDGNTIAGDGCDPFCHVEEGFTCSGGSPSSRDVCYPSEEIKMSLYTLKKTQFKNELAMEVQLQNYPMTITSETILPYLGLKINNVSDYRMRNVRFNAETGMLSMEVDYNETITDLFAELSLNTPEAYRAGVSYLPAVKALTVNFQIETAVAADYMPEAMSSTIRLLGEICFYLALALCGLALLALLFGWLEGVELLGYAQLTFLSTQVTNHLPELFSHPAQQLIVSFLHYDNLHVLDFIGLHTDESFSEFTIFNFRIEYAINGGWVLLCLILLLIIVVVVRFFKLCNDSTSSAQPAIGYLSRFILPKFAAVLTIPVLYFSSVFLFNSLYKPSTALTVNLVLSLSSILAIIGFFLSFAYQLNLSSVAHIHKLSQQFVSRREESCPSSKAELAPPAEEEPSEFHPKEQLVEGDLKSSLGSQFYLTFLWTSFISSAVAVSFTADFPAVRVSLLLFSRLVFSLYLVFFRPYKAMLSNLRLLLS